MDVYASDYYLFIYLKRRILIDQVIVAYGCRKWNWKKKPWNSDSIGEIWLPTI